jgi:S-DNA-T family DNA segregation ATPase FtsK/SpoIIIE
MGIWTGGPGAVVELWLSVVDPSADADVATDVLVRADPAGAVRELADGIGGLLGRAENGEGPVRLYVGGVPVDPGLPLDSSPIRDGAQVGLGSPEGCLSQPGQGIVELRVVGGPDAGGVSRLGPGSVTVGTGQGDLVRIEDPSVSAAALRVDIVADGSVTVRPGSNTTVTIEGGEALNGAAPWPRGHLLAIGATLLEIATPDFPDAPLRPSEDGTGLDYNRPPRIAPPEHESSFALPSRPRSNESRPMPWLMAIIPLVAAVVMARLFHNNMMLAFAILSPLSLVANFVNDRKQGKKSYRVQLEEYEERRAATEADAGAAFVAELAARRAAFPDPALLALTATGPRRRLWERRATDADRLALRVGTGRLPSEVMVSDPDQVEHRRRDPLLLRDAPVVLPLLEHGVVGIAGRAEEARALGRWVTVQSAVLHSPADLQIYVLTDPTAAPSWAWVRWLPHARPREGQNTLTLIGTTADTVARRISGLLAQLTARQQAQRVAGSTAARVAAPDILVILDGSRRLRALPGITQLLGEGPGVGIRAVCLDTDRSLLPEECTAVAVLDHTGRVVVDRSGHMPVTDVRPDGVGVAWCERVARALTPLRDVSHDDGSSLPDSCRLLDVLGLEPPTGSAIASGWRVGGRSTAAVIGASLDGPFAIDLETHGPHGLIAGTTGSGKSELLQTLVASLAVVNRPDSMTFVLIDYKGGSAFKECVRLPHTVGMVTDLDTHLVGRALESLAAELRRREHVFAAAGVAVPNLGAYVDARRRDPSLPAMPRLLIVIDEFASLARELPDFVSGLVNVAQRGRSLGIHLILATQRPSGVVSADIRANTNLRIALRVTDASESSDVIDAPDAARIAKSTPGRGYVRLEHASLLPFQAARVGGRRRGEAVTSAPPWVVALRPDQLGMPPPARPAAAGEASDSDLVTDLGVLVEAIRDANAELAIPPQHSPWLPALPTSVTLGGLAAELPVAAAGAPSVDVEAVVGVLRPAPYALVDVPGGQTRRVESVDLATFSHLYVAGAPRSGRSQALRTIAGSLALTNTAADVHLYGLDCGNGALLALTSLPHCGAVVRSTDGERADRLLGKLTAEMGTRMNALGERGFTDVNEQRASVPPGERMAHLVLLVDRWEGFLSSLGERDNGVLTESVYRLLREGASAGIHLVVSGDHTLLGGRIAPLTENKFALRLSDTGDFSLIGVPARSVPPDLPPGRAYRSGSGLQAQIPLLTEDPAGAAQAAALERIGVAATERDVAVPASLRPFGVDVLPSRIGFDAAWSLRAASPAPLWGMVAVGGDRLSALGPDLSVGAPAFVIAGPPESGRSNALLTLAASYLARGTEVVLVAPRPSPLRNLAGAAGVRDVLDGQLSAEALRQALAGPGHVVVLIDDAELLRDCDAADELTAIVRRQRGEEVGLVLAGDADGVCGGFSGWQVEAKKARRGLLLSPQNMTDADLIGVRLPRALLGRPVSPGRGVLHLGGGEVVVVQVPLANGALT